MRFVHIREIPLKDSCSLIAKAQISYDKRRKVAKVEVYLYIGETRLMRYTTADVRLNSGENVKKTLKEVADEKIDSLLEGLKIEHLDGITIIKEECDIFDGKLVGGYVVIDTEECKVLANGYDCLSRVLKLEDGSYLFFISEGDMDDYPFTTEVLHLKGKEMYYSGSFIGVPKKVIELGNNAFIVIAEEDNGGYYSHYPVYLVKVLDRGVYIERIYVLIDYEELKGFKVEVARLDEVLGEMRKRLEEGIPISVYIGDKLKIVLPERAPSGP